MAGTTDKFGILTRQVFPPVNTTVLDQLNSVDCIIYAMGSLFTSICPSLVSCYQFINILIFYFIVAVAGVVYNLICSDFKMTLLSELHLVKTR